MARLIAEVPVGGGAVASIPNPQSYADGGIGWRLSYGNVESVRHIAVGLLDSYDYLLFDGITTKEAIRRLRLMRRAYRDLAKTAGVPHV